MIFRLIAVALISLAALATPARAQTGSVRAQVVVELYTSQGCTQCPRGNRLLGWFAREPGVLALTFPVDIWDYLGWRDTLASEDFTVRHRAYSRALRVRGRFTPQLVMNGSRQLSASDWDTARAILEQEQTAAVSASPSLQVSRLRSGRVRVVIGRAQRYGPPADIWLIAYTPGPVNVVVTAGVNRAIVVPHYNLATRIERVDSWAGDTMWFERPWCTPRCAVLVQMPDGGPIIAAAFTSN